MKMENKIDCSFNYTSNWQHTTKARRGREGRGAVIAPPLEYLCLLLLSSVHCLTHETYRKDKTTRHNELRKDGEVLSS